MKLKKLDGSRFWHVEIVSEKGDIHLVNTFCLDKSEAIELTKSAKVEELETAGKAHRLTADVVTLITANRSITVEGAINEWTAWIANSARSTRTADNNVKTAIQWATECGIADKSIGTIAEATINGWVNREDDTKYGTRVCRLAAIRSLFRFCAIKRYVLLDPSQLVDVNHRKLSHSQKEVKHKAVFTDDEVDFLIFESKNEDPPAVSNGFLASAIILGRDLALRLGDICNLEWDSFYIQKKVVVVWQRKTGGRVEIPMTDRVARWVATRERREGAFVFPDEIEMANDVNRRAYLSNIFVRFFTRCGFEGRSFHSLRATYATTMANRGATMEEISKALGHTGSEVTKAYVKKEGAAKVAER